MAVQDNELTCLTRATVLTRRRQIALSLGDADTKESVTPEREAEIEAAEVTCQAAREKLTTYKWCKL